VVTEALKIGTHIRKLRRMQQMTLQDVADVCGFTKSLLSKIESGKTVPPVATLVKIARALNTTISTLVEEGNNIDCVFIPAVSVEMDMMKTENGYAIVPLAVEYKTKRMQPFMFTARQEDIQGKTLSHEGEEYIYVLDGSMQFQVGVTIYSMKSGDSLYFNAVAEHRIVSVSSDSVKYIDIFV